MKDIILVVVFLAMGVYGYLAMGKLDKFLDENRKAICKQQSQRRKPYIILKKDVNVEAVKDKVERFREDHPCACVVVCDPNEFDYADFEELRNA